VDIRGPRSRLTRRPVARRPRSPIALSCVPKSSEAADSLGFQGLFRVRSTRPRTSTGHGTPAAGKSESHKEPDGTFDAKFSQVASTRKGRGQDPSFAKRNISGNAWGPLGGVDGTAERCARDRDVCDDDAPRRCRLILVDTSSTRCGKVIDYLANIRVNRRTCRRSSSPTRIPTTLADRGRSSWFAREGRRYRIKRLIARNGCTTPVRSPESPGHQGTSS